MKTIEQIVQKWSEHCGVVTEGDDQNFRQALKEYGEAVRQKAAGVCREGVQLNCDCKGCIHSEYNASALERMELP